MLIANTKKKQMTRPKLPLVPRRRRQREKHQVGVSAGSGLDVISKGDLQQLGAEARFEQGGSDST